MSLFHGSRQSNSNQIIQQHTNFTRNLPAYLWYVHNLDRLKWITEGNDQVARLNHSPCLEQRECTIEIALHVIGAAKTEGNEPPLKIEPSPHWCRASEGENWAVWTAPWKERCHVTRLCVHKESIHSQVVSCHDKKGGRLSLKTNTVALSLLFLI